MGRPKLSPEKKRQQVNIRLDPADREHLQNIAERHGLPLAGVAESLLSFAVEIDRQAGESGASAKRLERLHAISGHDDETLNLLSQISDEIRRIELMTHKRWHKSRRSWAAVAQMLTTGPIRWNRIDSPQEDELLQGVAQAAYENRREKTGIVEELRRIGVVVELNPGGQSRVGVLAALSRGAMPSRKEERERERAIISALPNADDRKRGEELFAKLVALDVGDKLLQDRMDELIEPYVREELEGRNMYSEHRRALAEAAKEAGKPYIYEDLQ